METLQVPEITQDHPDYKFSKGVIALIKSFAENGKPLTGAGKEWKKFDNEDKIKLFNIAGELKYFELPEMMIQRFEFWSKLFMNELKSEMETPVKETF